MEFGAFSDNWVNNQSELFGLGNYCVPKGNDSQQSKPKTKKKYPSSLSAANMDNDLGNGMLSPSLDEFNVLMAPTPKDSERDLNDINWDQLNLDFSPFQKTLKDFSVNQHPQQGKRVISGTAIFGFQNHDKSFQLPHSDFNAEEANDMQMDDDANLDPTDVNTLLKQQRELRLALEQQKEANMELEKQLDSMKRQQSLSNSPELQQNQFTFNTLKVINTLDEVEQMFNSGGDELLESPTKKQKKNINKNSMEHIPEHYRKSSSTLRKMGNLFEELNFGMKDSSDDSLGVLHKTDSNIITYHNQLISPAFSTNFSPRNSNMDLSESITGDLNDGLKLTNISAGSMVLGLGLHSDKKASVNVMSSIPGSTTNSPRKVSSPKRKSETSNAMDSNFVNKFSSTSKLIFTSNKNNRESKKGTSEAVSNEEIDEVVNEASSPVLKSQAQLKSKIPQFQLNLINSNGPDNLSPVKITRKLTTLPRGSIDIYVKELEGKMFECLYPDCGKTFKRRYNVRSHIQTHLQDRPYKCDMPGCDKGFVRNHDLLRHKKCHEEKTFECPCGKKFNREDALIVHRCRMICIGGKQYENIVIKRSPRKRGRPRKNESLTGTADKDNLDGNSSTKQGDLLQKDVMGKLNLDTEKNVFLNKTSNFNMENPSLLLLSQESVKLEETEMAEFDNSNVNFDM
ncbi:hypothetical protein TPHA_0C00800 [Tetrapisispora phaffii CBS 4417]|uniref:C2H2-type domain-containing protein n=1 Tax=Tetrapisispora phaffii (strain ATCC 24235 / CBS 4417 / NBRC 1672 / NRRL Y-8282 / UCD 70-5) TaxID=1071381 RepID=G8BR60_TETPH|nr:hypothetical protein TPHA_0C00800 [Tetrapisispora phaffii CBS 4417]CCE62236.1 hypothetical protein TPHA_0C00800 [Tetrapisispora phaffii CBS 4417]